MTRPLAHDLLDRVRKALESVPLICGAPRQRYTRHTWSPDYDALAAKVAPLIEALEAAHRAITNTRAGGYDDALRRLIETEVILSVALATWRTEGST